MRDDSQPSRLSLNGDWLFRADNDLCGEHEYWFAPKQPTNDWQRVHVPGQWGQFGVADFSGAAWYRRTIKLPAGRRGISRGLAILGVDDSVRAWIDTRELERCAQSDRRAAFAIDPRLPRGQHTITIRLQDTGGPGALLGDVFIANYQQPDDLLAGPHDGTPARDSVDWVRDAVIYEVYLRSFSAAGTFAALAERLDELKQLGVTVVWLMPIHPIGAKRRKGTLGCPYAVQDYTATNPEHGSLDDFKALRDAVHACGMKLVIDWVVNHTAWDNPMLSEHPEWYSRGKDGKVRPPNPDWNDVADLNYDNKELRQAIADAMLFWIRDVGIDGFRCDVSGLVPGDFWDDVRPQLDAVRPVMMLAEDDQPSAHLRAFDLTYDWRLYDLLGRLRTGTLRPRDVIGAIADERFLFPANSLRLRFSTNHDKNAWDAPAIRRYGAVAAKAAAVLTYALPGVPLIYNGQECGNVQSLSLFERLPIDWRQPDHGLRELYTALGRLRADRASLRRGDTTFDAKPAESGVLCITRSLPNERTTTLINFVTTPRTIDLATLGLNSKSSLLESPTNKRAGANQLALGEHGYWIGAAD